MSNHTDNNVLQNIYQAPVSDAVCSLLSLSNTAKDDAPIHTMENEGLELPADRCDNNSSGSISEYGSAYHRPDTPPDAENCIQQITKEKFPVVLMALLEDLSNSDYARFKKHGKSFLILQPKIFASKILPRYFGMKNFSSFVRKLYRWGFRQSTYRDRKTGRVSYFHPKFRRGNLAMCREMTYPKENYKPAYAVSSAVASSRSCQPAKQDFAALKLDHTRREQFDNAPVRLLQHNVRQTMSPPASPILQQTANDATRPVLAAALDALGKSKLEEHYPTRQSPSIDLDQITLRLLGSSKIGCGPGFMSFRSNLLFGHPSLSGGASPHYPI